MAVNDHQVGYTVTDGNWHYGVMSFDGSTLRFYLDGAQISSQPFSFDTSTGSKFFSDVRGSLDEVAMYDHALTANQVSEHWTKGDKTGAACAAAPGSSYGALVRADKAQRYYNLDDANNTQVVLDASGHCQNGNRAQDTTVGSGNAIAGTPGGSLSSASNDFHISATDAGLPTGNSPRTLEGWFKTTSTGQIIGYEGVALVLNNVNTLNDHGNGTVLADGNWHYAAMTFDGTTLAFYIDGVPVGSQPFTFTNTTNSQLFSNLAGSLDDVAIYDHALPDDHIFLHYTAGKYAGLVGSLVNIRELLANGNFCYSCAAQALLSAAHALHFDPIDTTFGTFSEQVNDLSISGRGEPLMAMRSYSSAMAGDDGPFGYGWKGGYNAHLTVDATSGDATVSQENGGEVTFINNAGTYTPSAPRFIATLTHNGDGTWTMVRNHTETLTFNSNGQITSQADRNGITTTISYDGSGNLQTVTNAEGRTLTFSWTGTHITGVSDSSGRSVSFAYNGNGELATVTAADGGVTHYTYDSSHRLTGMLDPNQNGSSTPVPVTNVYDTSGRVTSQTDQLGRTSTFVYNTDGSVLVTDAVGNQSLDIYQNNIRVAVVNGYGTAQATTTHFAYDPRFGSVAATFTEAPGDSNDHATYATYDDNGFLSTSTDGMGRESSYTYDSLGDVTTATTPNPSSTGPAQVTTTNTYDSNGKLLTTTRPFYTSASAHTDQTVSYTRSVGAKPDLVSATTDPSGKTTSMGYDSIGQLTSTTSPEGRVTTYGHDNLGRVTTLTSPRGNVSGATASDFTTTTAYDAMDRVLSSSAANGSAPIVSTNIYDHNGNLTSATDGDNRTTTYTYNLANEQTAIHRPDTTTLQTTYYDNGVVHQQVDGAGQATTYGQDSLGRLASTEDPLHRVSSYTYDGDGNVITTTDSSSRVATSVYDNAGELTTTNYSDGTTPNVTVSYNEAGARVGMIDGSGTQSWVYDSLGRMTSQTNGANNTVGYGYDIRGELTSINYPGNGNVTRAYGDDGELNSVTDFNSNQTTFAYNQDLQLQTTNYANGVVGTNSYDNAGQVSNIAYAKGATNLATYGYGRTTGGDINAESDSGTSSGSNKTYTYNTLGQLATENGASFGYNTADNLTSINGTSQTYDVANEVQAHGSTTYGYDAQGNRTSSTTASVTTLATFDQANRMKSFGTSTYAYDGGGLRTSKTVGSATKNFVYDTAEGLPLIIDDGTDEYVYGPQGPIEQIAGETASYLHNDQLGSIRLITDNSGNTSGTYQFDAYGNTTAHTGTDTSLRYAGQYLDNESGLYWMRARYYDPNTGQFVSRDPMVMMTSEPYGYTSQDPLNEADPSGLICVFGSLADGSCKGSSHNLWVSHPQAMQRTLDASAGVLDGMTLGHANAVLPSSAQDSWQHSGWYFGGEAFGSGVLSGGGIGEGRAAAEVTKACSEGASSGRIGMSADRVSHVYERHLADGSQSAGKSVFNDNEVVTRLIQDAAKTPSSPQTQGANFQRVVDAGRPIGTDRATGLQTNTYTVITNRLDQLVTAFPGLPGS